ncbi:DoxX family protein [Pseudonocardia sp.]|uniref:DoxX family protein n=1 Tax=Pseudonocardia sp. TaxID=60912 RepID=UPI002629DB5A|nr:DoxX family protein [Pseudonocardia sp.]
MNGAEIAGLVLRASVGSTMVAHGIRHGRSLEGTARWFGSIGFARPRLQAAASAAVEIGAGGLLLVGTATPVAAAAVVGTMAVATRSVHAENGFFITAEGYEYVLTLAAAATAVSALGAGTASVDRWWGRGSGSCALQRVAVTVGLGLGAAAVQLLLFWRRPSPPAVAEQPTTTATHLEPLMPSPGASG